MLLREEFEAREDRVLAPYALRSKDSRGRKYPDSPHAYRSAFQRDKERIIYTTAFRRLEYKTQVFVNHEGDHYRTRLTHSLEVSLVSRSIARALCLNEDLVEAVALAHDLGHSPFGHAGEVVLNQLTKTVGGFEHNGQSLRIVEELEDCYQDFKGINLSFEVLEGLKKHAQARLNALEFQVANLADDIAYNAHDLDDGLRSNYLSLDEVKKLKVWSKFQIEPQFGAKGIEETRYQKTSAIRRLINYQIMDVINHSKELIDALEISSVEDLQAESFEIISFSPEVKEEIKELRLFLHDKLYLHPKVKEMTEMGRKIIEFLFAQYTARGDQMPKYFTKQIPEVGLKRVICDYIAGMTDRFAYKEYERLKSPPNKA